MISTDNQNKSSPTSGFRLIALGHVFEGEPFNACKSYLHPLFERAKTVIILANQPSLDQIASLTCGMQPLVGSSTHVTLILNDLQIHNRPNPIPTLLSQRMGILSHLRKNNLLDCIIIPSEPPMPRTIESLCGEPMLLLTDSSGDSVAINWERPFNYQQWATVTFSSNWSWGDPLRKVKKIKGFIEDFLRSCITNQDLKARDEFYVFLDSIEPVQIPFLEDFPDEIAAPQISLYPHQQKAIDSWIQNGRKGIFKMCTGSGKTITSLFALKSASPSNGPILITVPTRVLADQWSEQVKKLGYSKILMAYENSTGWIRLLEPWLRDQSEESPRFVITTYKTFSDERFLEKFDRFADSGFCGIWIADEMHNLASSRLLGATDRVGKSFSQRIGLSATPEIEGNESMTKRLFEFFGGIVATYELKEGIDDGVLCQYNYHPVPAYLDPSKGAEYIRTLQSIDRATEAPTQLMELYRQSRELIRKSGVQVPALNSILDQLLDKNEDLKHTLVYCPPGFSGQSADQSDEIESDETQSRLLEDVVDAIRKRGLSVSSILGETPKAQRGEILSRFSSGTLDVLCAIGCLDEGIDIPSIKRAIVLYSIDREKQFVQRRGRILRTIRGTLKTADIYDVVILPHGTDMSTVDAERLLNKELRRYRAFSDLALNATEANQIIETALTAATEVKI